MRVTALTRQQKNPDRINVMIDGAYTLSLTTSQVLSLGIRVDSEFDEASLAELESESQYGKLYARTLEYCLMRPHSEKEVRDYLYKKTLQRRTKAGDLKDGVRKELTERVFAALKEKAYVNDDNFTRFWVENRNRQKGMSKRKLVAELRAKGVASDIIDRWLGESDRDDDQEIRKIVAKKASRYEDPQKLMAYLARQGFDYETIKRVLSQDE